MQRAKAELLRRIALAEASTASVAQGLNARWDLDLPLDEPTVAAKKYISLEAEDVRAALSKWLRPRDLARVTEGPNPR